MWDKVLANILCIIHMIAVKLGISPFYFSFFTHSFHKIQIALKYHNRWSPSQWQKINLNSKPLQRMPARFGYTFPNPISAYRIASIPERDPDQLYVAM